MPKRFSISRNWAGFMLAQFFFASRKISLFARALVFILGLSASVPASALPAKEIKSGSDEATVLGNIAMIQGIQMMQDNADDLGDPEGAMENAIRLARAASIYATGKKLADVSARASFAKGQQLQVYPSVFKSPILSDYVRAFEEQVGMKLDTAISSLNKGIDIGVLSKANSASVSSGLIADITRNASVLSVPALLEALDFNVDEIQRLAASFNPTEDERNFLAGNVAPEFTGGLKFALKGAASQATGGGSFFGDGGGFAAAASPITSEFWRAPASDFSGMNSPVMPTEERVVYKAEVSEDILNAFDRRDGGTRPLFEMVHDRYQKIAPSMMPAPLERIPASVPTEAPAFQLDTSDVQL